MRWPWQRKSREPGSEHEWAAAQRRQSEELLRRSQEEVVVPLRRMRERNNVTELARRLLAQERGGEHRGPRAAH